MFSKTFTFKDFNGKKVTREFWFHLSKAELLKLGVGNVEARIKRITDAQDGVKILEEFAAFVEMSVGMRSEDGSMFIKDDDAKHQLMFSPAYDELLFELCTDADVAASFINNLLPKEMLDELAKQIEQTRANQPPAPPSTEEGPFAEPKDERPQWMKERRLPTAEEFAKATPEEKQHAFAMKMGTEVKPEPPL